MEEVEVLASFQIGPVTFTVTMESEGVFLEQSAPGVYRKKQCNVGGNDPDTVRQRAAVFADEMKRQLAEGRFG